MSDALWQVFFTAVIAVFSAWAGAKVGGEMALKAAREQMDGARTRAEEDEKRGERSLLVALNDELEHAWKGYMEQWAPRFEALKVKGAFLDFRLPAITNPFPIYAANAGQLGRVTNDQLRQQIIAVFSMHHGMLANLEMNTQLIDEFNAAWKVAESLGMRDPLVSDPRVKAHMEKLIGYAVEIERAHVRIFQQTTGLIGQFKQAGIS